MLTIVRSPESVFEPLSASMPAGVLQAIEPARQEPEQCTWVVPSQRRRRWLERRWPASDASGAAFLPRFDTLEGFVRRGLAHSPRQRPILRPFERRLLIAQCWQEASGTPVTAGMVEHLDRAIREIRAAPATADLAPAGVLERTVQRFAARLESEACLDAIAAVRLLTSELCDPQSWPSRLLGRTKLAVFEGFHRLEPFEQELIAGLARRCDVLLGLVGIPGQDSWSAVQRITQSLEELAADLSVLDHLPEPTRPLVGLGRSCCSRHGEDAVRGCPETGTGTPYLVPTDRGSCNIREPVPVSRQPLRTVAGLYELKAPDVVREVQAVAAQIKADYLASQQERVPLRLSDVAVVLPSPTYDAVVREAFPRAGLEFNLAGQALTVMSSRPARVLLLAVEVVQSGWRRDRVIDFLCHPIVGPHIRHRQRLEEVLQRLRLPRGRGSYQGWLSAWQRYLDRTRRRIEIWRGGQLAVPENSPLSTEEWVEQETRRLREVEELVESLKAVLGSVAEIEVALKSANETAAHGSPEMGTGAPWLNGGTAFPGRLPIDGPNFPGKFGLEARSPSHIGEPVAVPGPNERPPLAPLIDALLGLMEKLRIDRWLSPAESSAAMDKVGSPVPWVEFEKDQRAYLALLAVLRSLASMPASRLPQVASGDDSSLTVLRIALAAQAYQIRTEDDAGVQLVGFRELRGLEFRHVYGLGLTEAALAAPRDGDGIGEGDSREEDREAEASLLFTRLFESAREKLVLSAPQRAEDRSLSPSPFLKAVHRHAVVPPLPGADLLVTAQQVAHGVGRMAAASPGPLESIWPNAPADVDRWRRLFERVRRWQGLEPKTVRIRAALARAMFPGHQPFSASGLEVYAACPFRFFGSKALRLDEREPDEVHRDYGLLVHRVLQRFYDPGVQAGQEDGKGRLLAIFDAEWAAMGDTLPIHLRTLFETDNGIADLVMEAVGRVERNLGCRCRHVELVLEEGLPNRGLDMGQDENGCPVLLAGKIDRVDVTGDGNGGVVILDYKTGRPLCTKRVAQKMADGRLLQLSIYAEALQRRFPDYQVVAAAYVHVHERVADPDKGLLVSHRTGEACNGPAIPLDPQAAWEKTRQLASRIRAGDFSLTSFDLQCGPQNTECTRLCVFRDACRQPAGYQMR